MRLPTPAAGTFEKCPAGNHLATCYEVIDLGTQAVKTMDGERMKRQIWIGWETPHELMEDGRPFVIGRKYTLSGHEKSSLRKDLESWRGKAFSTEDFGSFQIEKLIGKSCFLNVVHTQNGDKTYANISSVAALPKGTASVEPVNAPVYFSLDAEDFAATVLEGLSEYFQGVITSSPEYAALTGKPARATVPPADSGSDEGDETPF